MAQTIFHLVNNDFDSCCFLQIDLRRVFDNICHDYLWEILEHINTGQLFTRWIKLCYKHATSQIIVNNNLTEKIDVNCSVRQGCPLSMLLFVPCIEPLFRYISSNNLFVGYTLSIENGPEIKYFSYADDITLVLTDIHSIDNIKSLFTDFETVSGIAININKCKGLWFGTWSDLPQNYGGFSWTSNHLKILGTLIGKNTKCQWDNIIDKVRKASFCWNGRHLSLYGKAKIAN